MVIRNGREQYNHPRSNDNNLFDKRSSELVSTIVFNFELHRDIARTPDSGRITDSSTSSSDNK